MRTPTEYAQTVNESVLLVLEQIGNMTTKQISELVPTSRGYIGVILRRAEEKGIVTRVKDPNDLRINIWDFKGKFRRFIFTLRVLETRSMSKDKHRWIPPLDVEATISGTVPIDWDEDKVREKFKVQLKEKMLELLSVQNPPVLTIPDELIIMEEKGISGVQLIDDFIDEGDDINQIEVVFTSSTRKRYKYEDVVNARLDQFE